MASEVVHKMKEPEYKEGPEATKNFEEGMKALFNVPEDEVVMAEKKRGKGKTSSRVQSVRKQRVSDKDRKGSDVPPPLSKIGAEIRPQWRDGTADSSLRSE